MNTELLLKFSDLLNQFRQVRRKILVNGEEREENDQEHSFALAMLVWYAIDAGKLDLDATKAFTYALVHDLVEVYAGDTYLFSKDTEYVLSKEDREREAKKRLSKEFPEFQELHRIIDMYEKREDKESRFVYALDKIQPLLNIYLDSGRTWKEFGVTLNMLIEAKDEKVKVSPEVAFYWEELKTLFKEKETDLFPKDTLEERE